MTARPPATILLRCAATPRPVITPGSAGQDLARSAGNPSAVIIDRFPTDEAFTLPGSDAKIVPCSAETRSATCVECRLCLDADELLRWNVAIGFDARGPDGGKKAREALTQIRVPKPRSVKSTLRSAS